MGKSHLATCKVFEWEGGFYQELNMQISQAAAGSCAHIEEDFYVFSSEWEATNAAYRIIIEFLQKGMTTQEDEVFYKKVVHAYKTFKRK